MKRYIIKCEIKKYQTILFLIEGIDLYIRYKMLLTLMLKLFFVKPKIINHIAIFHPPFIPSSAFYPLISLLSSHPPFILPSAFYPPMRLLSSHAPFILPCAFYPPIRRLFPQPPFTLPSVFYPPIRLLSPHPPSESVKPSAIRIGLLLLQEM